MSAEKARLANLEKKRKEMLVSRFPPPHNSHESSLYNHTDFIPTTTQDGFATQKSDLLAETQRNRSKLDPSDRFVGKVDGVEDSLKRSTYGLVQLSAFKETREKLEEKARRDAAGAGDVK